MGTCATYPPTPPKERRSGHNHAYELK